MTDQAQRADIRQIALPTTLSHRHDMIRIPQAAPRHPLQAPARQQLAAPSAARAPHLPVR
jgi:hypothetical protein